MTLNPLNQRRWQNFKSNKRGYYSLWLFSFAFILALGAEFIANDKPLLVKYQGNYYFPVLHTYPETTFGGDFELEMDYRQDFAKELIDGKGWMLWPLIHYSYDTINYARIAPAKPSSENWLGTDDQGRDVLARVM